MNRTLTPHFQVDQFKCIRCGECVNECPVNILVIGDQTPFVADGRGGDCIGCQHCLAVCPEGAVSVLGLRPADSYPLSGADMPTFAQIDRLIRGRRSVRRYRDDPVDQATIEELLHTAFQAPSGRNDRQVSYSVVGTREAMDRVRAQVFDGLSELISKQGLPAGYEFFVDIVNGWKMYQADVLFRWAPHLVIACAPEDSASGEADGIISLSYFEIAAQTYGIGTLWNGLVKIAIRMLPEVRTALGIPDNNRVAFAMSFGWPDVSYARSVQYAPQLRIID